MFRNFLFRFPVLASVGDRGDRPGLDWFVFQHDEHHGKERGRHHGKHHGRPRHHESLDRNWGDEHRTRRGDIKFILLEMLSDGPSHGYNLIREMESRYGEFRRLSPGSVYPTLQMLEEGGYLTSEQVSGKRVYTITDTGKKLLAERSQESPSDSSKELRNVPPEFSELRNTVTDLSVLVMQIARSRNTSRMSQVRELLEQVKRDIHGMLAEKSIEKDV
ncbi:MULTISPECIES: PadR family transcriptional regulator [unclassified Microcoleus]|uniref:PadR family transcriptional regulator n=1 Tax=unclassified Microcoleus TaxID=2642155 RepID=UPI002FD10D3E